MSFRCLDLFIQTEFSIRDTKLRITNKKPRKDKSLYGDQYGVRDIVYDTFFKSPVSGFVSSSQGYFIFVGNRGKLIISVTFPLHAYRG